MYNKLEPYINQNIMKKFLAMAIMGLMLTAVVSACGSSKGGHCDAYGNVDHVENSDMASL